jgi:pimeloyl-ACP methyl ester carboxylesterase
MNPKHPPNGPAIVLLHGFPLDRSMWREQVDFLNANGFRAIAPDLHGSGAMSDKLQFVAEGHPSRTITTMEDMARDVAARLDNLEIDRAVVGGLSMGSYVAFEFVHHFPLRVRALVLAGARAQGADETEKKSREEKAQQLLTCGIAPFVEGMLPNLLAPKSRSEKPAVVARVCEMISRTDPQGAAAAQRGMAARRDYSGDLAGIAVPTLIIAGREDAVRKPEDAEFIHHGVKNSHREIIDAAGHLMNMEQPEIFNKVLAGFLESLH